MKPSVYISSKRKLTKKLYLASRKQKLKLANELASLWDNQSTALKLYYDSI